MIAALLLLLSAAPETGDCVRLYGVRLVYESAPAIWTQQDIGPVEFDRALAAERRERIARQGWTWPAIYPGQESETVIPPGAFRRGPQVQAWCCWIDRPLPERRCEERP